MSKKILRKRLINFRKINFSDKNISLVKFKKILNNLNNKKIYNIGGYFPINSEIGCFDVLKKMEKNKFKISLPVTKRNNDMDFYEWSFQEPLKVSKRGIPEPYKNKIVYPDVLIVPLVGFDNNKFRLGYGGGFYDRYISKVLKFKKIITIGFAFSFQNIKNMPVNKFDQKLDFILTDHGSVR